MTFPWTINEPSVNLSVLQNVRDVGVDLARERTLKENVEALSVALAIHHAILEEIDDHPDTHIAAKHVRDLLEAILSA